MPPTKPPINRRWQPEIIVGVDFGMTCTGVVYAKLTPDSKTSPEIKQIKRWPGARDQVLEKVPTELIYTDDTNIAVQSWGAECKKDVANAHRTRRWFKLAVPAQTTKSGITVSDSKGGLANDSTTTLTEQHDGDSARQYFEDYIKQLVTWVDSTLEDQVPRFRFLNVEYVFSIPTSWSLETSTLHNITSIIREAVGESATRRARIGLTEAAAAAVETGRDSCTKGDVVLVIDTGGGTTDINIFKYLSTSTEPARIKALTYDEGEDIGSTRIDQLCLEYMNSRILETVSKEDSSIWFVNAATAIRTTWPDLKHSYGDSTSISDPYYYIPLGPIYQPSEHLATNSPSPDLIPPPSGHGTYTFRIPSQLLQSWFDSQITLIISLISRQLTNLTNNHRNPQVNRLVLSGGFATNKYYRTQLRNHFNLLTHSRPTNQPISPQLEILTAPEPHLAVVRGLVYNRIRELIGNPTYESVISPISFGFVVSEEYSKLKHSSSGEVPVISPVDGKQWIRGQIDWIIEEGVPIPSKGLKREYDILLPPSAMSTAPFSSKSPTSPTSPTSFPNNITMHDADSPTSPNSAQPQPQSSPPTQTFHLVSSHHPRRNLPRNISHKAVRDVCTLTIDLAKLASIAGTTSPSSRRRFSLSRTLSRELGKSSKGKLSASYTPTITPSTAAAAAADTTPSSAGTGTEARVAAPFTQQNPEIREAKFDLYVLIGAADLRFEVRPRGGDDSDSLLSDEHEIIDVAWNNAADRNDLSRMSSRSNNDMSGGMEGESSGIAGREMVREGIVKRSGGGGLRKKLGVRSGSFT